MKKLSSYIFWQLLFTVGVIVVVLSCIMWLVQTLRYIELISNKGVPISLFLKMIIYLLPNIFVIIVPIALLLGVLFIYNKLTADHELVAMQAAGVSPWQLAKPVVFISILLSMFLYSITLYFLPFSFRKHRDMVVMLKQESLTSLISDGQFSTFKNYTIYAHHQDARGHFSGVLLYDGTQPNISVFFMAEEGDLVSQKGGAHLILSKGSRQKQDLLTGKPSVLYFDRYVIDSKNKMFENKKEERLVKAYERSTWELLNPQQSLDPCMQKEFSSAAHQRLLFPLYSVTFGLLAVSLMVLGYFNRKGRVGRIVGACVLTLCIEVIEMVLFHGWSGKITLCLCYGIIFLPMAVSLYLLSSPGNSLNIKRLT